MDSATATAVVAPAFVILVCMAGCFYPKAVILLVAAGVCTALVWETSSMFTVLT